MHVYYLREVTDHTSNIKVMIWYGITSTVYVSTASISFCYLDLPRRVQYRFFDETFKFSHKSPINTQLQLKRDI